MGNAKGVFLQSPRMLRNVPCGKAGSTRSYLATAVENPPALHTVPAPFGVWWRFLVLSWKHVPCQHYVWDLEIANLEHTRSTGYNLSPCCSGSYRVYRIPPSGSPSQRVPAPSPCKSDSLQACKCEWIATILRWDVPILSQNLNQSATRERAFLSYAGS